MIRYFFLVVFHILLALAMHRFSMVSTVHAIGAVFIGLFWAGGGRNMERTAYLGAYIAGSEILWRMTKADVFWEYGKYAMSLVFLCSLFSRGFKRVPFPILFFLLLIPSSFLGASVNIPLHILRKILSFNLSGPFALMAAVLFFSRIKFRPDQLHHLFFAYLAPAIGIAAIAFFDIYTAEKIEFTTESNFLTSGGFGPNQISGALSLGALFSYFLLLDPNIRKFSRLFITFIGIFLLIQCVLTFSRGGLYFAAAGASAASFFLIQNSRIRNRIISVMILMAALSTYIVIPRLAKFTGGALLERFESTDLTHRQDIIQSDLQIWKEHFYFGVGAGQARYHRKNLRGRIAAHTEFTRLLAEHGMFGLGALLLLILMGLTFFKRAKTIKGKALSASTFVWSFMYMAGYAMRVAAPSFVFGLAALSLLPDRPRPQKMQVTKEEPINE